VTIPAERQVRRTTRALARAGAARSGPTSGRDGPPLIMHRSDRITLTRHPVLLPPRTRIEETVVDLTQCAATFDEAYDWLSQACGGRLCTVSMMREALVLRKKLRYRAEFASRAP
jgi:hypothetical protein